MKGPRVLKIAKDFEILHTTGKFQLKKDDIITLKVLKVK